MPELAERLGIEHLTVFVVRPDGHVGLRFDGSDAAPLHDYPAPLSYLEDFEEPLRDSTSA